MNAEARLFKFHDFRHDYMYVIQTIGTVLGLMTNHAFVSGQAVTIQTEPVKVEYYRMPDEPLDATYNTYTAEIDIPFRELSKTDLSEGSLVNTDKEGENF